MKGLFILFRAVILSLFLTFILLSYPMFDTINKVEKIKKEYKISFQNVSEIRVKNGFLTEKESREIIKREFERVDEELDFWKFLKKSV